MNPHAGAREFAVEIRHVIDCPRNVQADEQWSHVGSKKNQRWLWCAIDAATGCVLSFVLGKRTKAMCKKLLANLKTFNIQTYSGFKLKQLQR